MTIVPWSYLLFAPPVLAVGFTAVFLGRLALRARQTRAIRVHGVPAEARVLDVADTGTLINYKPLMAVTLEVVPADGAPYRAVLKKVLTMADAGAFQRGAIIDVKYDPAHRDRVAVVMRGD